jgi:hypothetical protein
MKLENLLFASNREVFTTTPIGVGTMEHRQLDLALHLAHWMLVNMIEHLKLNVIFQVYIPLKNCI